jgi:hypothetical protein
VQKAEAVKPEKDAGIADSSAVTRPVASGAVMFLSLSLSYSDFWHTRFLLVCTVYGATDATQTSSPLPLRQRMREFDEVEKSLRRKIIVILDRLDANIDKEKPKEKAKEKEKEKKKEEAKKEEAKRRAVASPVRSA